MPIFPFRSTFSGCCPIIFFIFLIFVGAPLPDKFSSRFFCQYFSPLVIFLGFAPQYFLFFHIWWGALPLVSPAVGFFASSTCVPVEPGTTGAPGAQGAPGAPEAPGVPGDTRGNRCHRGARGNRGARGDMANWCARATVSQLAQVVLFYPGFWGFLKTCVISKMFLSKTTMLVVKTVRAFEKQYLRFAFLNFKSLCYFCLEVRTFDFTSKSRFSRKKNPPPPFGSQTGEGVAPKHIFFVFLGKKLSSV